MLGAALTLLLGLPFAFANRAFADPTPKFAYVTNYCPTSGVCLIGTVSAYTINSSTGALRAVAGSPFAAGQFPISVTVDPSGRFAYVANECESCTRGTVSAYTINSSTGALSVVSGSPFAAGTTPTILVTVDPSGRFAYVANECDGCSQERLGLHHRQLHGGLARISGSPFAAGFGPDSVTVDPSGQFAYVTDVCDISTPQSWPTPSTARQGPCARSPVRPSQPGTPSRLTVDPRAGSLTWRISATLLLIAQRAIWPTPSTAPRGLCARSPVRPLRPGTTLSR